MDKNCSIVKLLSGCLMVVALLAGCTQPPAQIERKTDIYKVVSGRYPPITNTRPVSTSSESIQSQSIITEESISSFGSGDGAPSNYKVHKDRAPSTIEKSLERANVNKNQKTREVPQQKITKQTEVRQTIKHREEVTDLLNEIESQNDSGLDALQQQSSSQVEVEVQSKPHQTPAASKHYRLESPLGNSAFMWPVDGPVAKHFGEDDMEGIVIKVPSGTSIKAAGVGKVIYRGVDPDEYGQLVIIDHKKHGIMTAYAHNSSILVKEGDEVAKGQVIAKSGSSGNAKEPQSYFSVRHGDTTIDPEKVLN